MTLQHVLGAFRFGVHNMSGILNRSVHSTPSAGTHYHKIASDTGASVLRSGPRRGATHSKEFEKTKYLQETINQERMVLQKRLDALEATVPVAKSLEEVQNNFLKMNNRLNAALVFAVAGFGTAFFLRANQDSGTTSERAKDSQAELVHSADKV